MKVFRLWLLLLAVLVGAAARASPVAYGQQLCVMLTSVISQQKGWDYIVRDHSKAAMANSQTVIPWYSAASAGWALGTALGNAESAQKELATMKPDVFKFARTTCPQEFR